MFSAPEKHRIYYWNELETASFIGSGDEGNNDGCAKSDNYFNQQDELLNLTMLFMFPVLLCENIYYFKKNCEIPRNRKSV